MPAGLADGVVTADELPLALTLADVVVGASGNGSAVMTDAPASRRCSAAAAPLVLVDLAACGRRVAYARRVTPT